MAAARRLKSALSMQIRFSGLMSAYEVTRCHGADRREKWKEAFNGGKFDGSDRSQKAARERFFSPVRFLSRRNYANARYQRYATQKPSNRTSVLSSGLFCDFYATFFSPINDPMDDSPLDSGEYSADKDSRSGNSVEPRAG